MAILNVVTNIDQVLGNIKEKIAKATNAEYLLRPLAFDAIDLMTQRIHIEGKNAAGAPIGTYKPGYLRLRTGKYNRNADSKMIVSLTRQLENDWSVIPNGEKYGVGFKNAFNLQKARWVEEGAKAHGVRAHTREVFTGDKPKTVKVAAHQNKGWAGKGPIFSMTTEELEYITNRAIELVNKALQDESE